jgi:hypothetical protein
MGKECISKLYIGHLPLDTMEDGLKTFLLTASQLPRNAFSVTVKNGYAFMQCCDQGRVILINYCNVPNLTRCLIFSHS